MSIESPKVSIGLPVYNGENFVREAIDSILSQTFEDFELIISDNASVDQTEEICRAFAAQDERVRYFRNQENVGASRNFTRVFELASGEYFKWAAHDDVCLPDFLSRCVEVLDQDPSVVLCQSRAASIGADGEIIRQWEINPELGSAYPHQRFKEILAIGEEIYFVWGLIRRNILAKTPLLGSYVGHDRPLLSGLSLLGRIQQIPEVLFLMREHQDRSVHTHNWRRPQQAITWYDPSKTGKIIFPNWRLLVEHVAGINRAPLGWRERLLCYREMWRWFQRNRHSLWSDLVVAGEHVPGLKSNWLKRLDRTLNDIESAIPVGDTFILVDEEMLETEIFGERSTIPFLERDGMYWGLPPDDDTAIRELERLRCSGANFIVFAWPAFWWLEYYAEFRNHLRLQFQKVVENDRFIVFDLRS